MTTAPRDENSYDRVPYESHAFPLTHPEHLCAVGRLLGMDPADPSSARVLEIGCSSGGNAIPVAWRYPGARVVGLDGSRAQIERGRRAVGRLGITNVELVHGDILDEGDGLGEFDYVIAHGIYSWVPRPVQDALLRRFARHLAPGGVGFLSHNVYPGFHFRQLAREAALFHAPLGLAPDERLARSVGFVEFLARSSTPAWREYRAVLAEQVRIMREHPPWFTLHDILNEDCDAVYFTELVARLRAAGLDFVADAEWHSMLPIEIDAEAAGVVAAMTADPLAREQHYDFLRNRVFRQSLVCRAGATFDRDPRHPERLAGLWLSGSVPAASAPDASGEVRFESPRGLRVQTRRAATVRALRALTERFPTRAPVDELCAGAGDEAAALREDLLALVLYGVLDLAPGPVEVACSPSQRPEASPVARAQAMEGLLVTSLLHTPVRLHPLEADLLRQLDGTRTRDELLDCFGDALSALGPGPSARGASLERLLESFAANALLVG